MSNEVFKNLGQIPNELGFAGFFDSVLCNGKNFLTPRNKFVISWSGTTDLVTDHIINEQRNAEIRVRIGANELETSLNTISNFVDDIVIPDTALRSPTVIDDGRGIYLANDDGMAVPSNTEFSIAFKEQMYPVAASLFYMLIQFNGLPFQRPAVSNCCINHISDLDGKTIVAITKLTKARPIRFEHVKVSHNNKEIVMRMVTFAMTRIEESYSPVASSNSR